MITTIDAKILRRVIDAGKKMARQRWYYVDGIIAGVTDGDMRYEVPCQTGAAGLFDIFDLDLKSKCVEFEIDVTEKCPESVLPPATTVNVDAAALLSALSQCVHAVAADESRMTLNSLHCEFVDYRLTLTATNGHIMARRVIGYIGYAPDGADYLLPLSAVKLLIIALKKQAGDVIIGMPPKLNTDVQTVPRLHFNFGDTRISAGLIEGRFPNIEQLNINRKTPGEVLVDRAAFLAGVETTPTRMTGDKKAAILRLDINEKIMIEGVTDIPADKIGEYGMITLDRDYLVDALKSFSDVSITMSYGTPLDMVIVRGANDAINLIMPLRM